MKSINLFLLCQIDDPETFRDYANILSRRPQTRTVRVSEQSSLHALIAALSEKRLRFRSYDDFFYSFNIRHIGKEFDLLKIKSDRSRILNIELKSETVGTYRIRKQLLQNRYYLSHITLNVHSFTYVSSTDTVYTLNDREELIETTIDHLRDELRDDTGWLSDNIEGLFDANDYLISPTRTPQRFLSGQYFLTQQQETYKTQIREAIDRYQGEVSPGTDLPVIDSFKCGKNNASRDCCPPGLFLGISGSPGTGKTLLLYDLAKSLSDRYRVCVIHCGKLLPGHLFLKKQGWDIAGLRQIGDAFAFEKYDILLVDEAQRIYQNQFDVIKTMTADLGLVCIMAYDPRQVLLASEMRRNIGLQVERLSRHTYKLSEKIRANRELDSFMRVLLESNPIQDHCTYEHIDVLYARTEKECDSFRSNYMNRGYTFINFRTTSLASVSGRAISPAQAKNVPVVMTTSFGEVRLPSGAASDCTGTLSVTETEHIPTEAGGIPTVTGNAPRDNAVTEYDAGKVIGLEFEKVVMVLDENFYYDEKGVLRAKKHPNPDYLYDQLLYQGITRTREKLCLIIVGNFPLFKHITEMIRGRY